MDIIKSSNEITSLFNTGRRVHTPYVTLIISGNKYGRTDFSSGRVAFVAGKRNGNAVWRNSAKRRMREIYRFLHLEQMDVQIVFVAKKSILSVPYQNVLQSVQKVIPKVENIGD